MGNIKGVALVELLIVVAISGVIGTVIVAIHLTQERIYASEDAYMNMYRSTRTVIDRITNTLRMAGYNPRDVSQFNPGIDSADSDCIVIVIDYNGDGILDSNERVVHTSHSFASQGIDSLGFVYLDRRHSPLPLPVPDTLRPFINSVRVTLVIRRGEKLAGPERYELSREVQLRN